MKSNVPPGVTDIVRSFNPFGGTYPADPYRFFSEARAATSVFYHPETNFWVVTRYNDIRQIFQNTKLFSASNALDTPGVCPAAGKIYVDANFNVVPTITNTDHPHDTRVRRLANSAFTTKGGRNARNHVSLGIGNHLCLGAPLARLEARVVFEEFSRRFPSLHLVPGQQLRYQPNTFFRAPVSLLANWDA